MWGYVVSCSTSSGCFCYNHPKHPPLRPHLRNPSKENLLFSSFNNGGHFLQFTSRPPRPTIQLPPCDAQRSTGDGGEEGGATARAAKQAVLWAAEGAYVLWLFLLPYAPGDPVWAIDADTVNELVGLSLNFFFILPLANLVGIDLIHAPQLHPVSEGLFNFVIGWTLMFAPLLFTDNRRDRYKGSLDVLWGFQMFLTNTFLIPYMAIRLNEVEESSSVQEPSKLASVMVNGSVFVGLTGGAVCLLSVLWSLFGRGGEGFGGVFERWEFFVSYIGSERLANAFIWDIFLYTVFQPWLIGDNLQNVDEKSVGVVRRLRFVPVVGLVAYLLSLDYETES
ncbi:hypothetical protein QJS10_CPB12g01493 [Acorus calamus]|uniref:Transmembrane protein n=1 Tax=Acorus calamus TaxID=4465 RepID=A0AAV9DK66_ACOCL|nr:hypothetical protein QJS10_CPB12g01493 [Acorus calamus]